MAGVNLIYGMGMLELGVTFSFAQLLIDDEIARMVKRVVSGVVINDETLAVDLIRKVGGGTGKHYLMEEHTMDHVRTEQSRGKLFDRKMRMTWEGETGGKDAGERAADKAREILNEYQPEPLDKDVQAELRKIVASMEK
jgi:trimethylamine--corrinoid protein Co-methyltransferase